MNMNKRWFSIALIMLLISTGCQKKTVNVIRYVNPLIGTGKSTGPVVSKHTQGSEAWGQVTPAVSTPFGMTQWTPQTRDTENKSVAPYYYGGKKIQGFRGSHWLGGSYTQDYGSFTIMPMTGYLRTFAKERASSFVHESETSTPAYYSCMLETYNTFVEMTGTARSGFFKFSYLEKSNAIIFITPNSDEGQGYVKIDPDKQEIYGYNPVYRVDKEPGQLAGFSGYFVIRFNKTFSNYGCSFQMEDHKKQTEISGKPDIGAYAAFDILGDDVILAKVGTSFTSIEEARANLNAEIPHWDFEKTKAETEQLWNQTLSAVQLKGGKTEDYTTFYTALYHSMLFPRTFSDVDGSYPEFDGHKAVRKIEEGHVYYDDFFLADAHCAQLSLLSLIAPDKYEDMMKSLVLKAEQGGWLPNQPMRNTFTPDMDGDPANAALGDAYLKGFDINIEKAYPYMRKNAFAKDNAMTDFVLSRVAEKYGKTEDAAILAKQGSVFFSTGIPMQQLWLISQDIPGSNDLKDPVEIQKKVKNILSTEYTNYDGGIPGNDNAGQTSSWYVFSAMGFYPVSPGSGEYQLSSPIFSEVELNLNPKYYPGKRFKIIANNSDTASTFNTVKLNDKNHAFVLKHEDIRSGGQLVFSNTNSH